MALALSACAHPSANQAAVRAKLLAAQVSQLGAEAGRLAERATQSAIRTTRPAVLATKPGRPGLRHNTSTASACPPALSRVPPSNPIAPLSRGCVRALARHPRRMFRDIERRTFNFFWLTANP
ncbi:MAG: hypothetical protein ACYCYH_07795, partial [Steroidobacteraceae bacterium]